VILPLAAIAAAVTTEAAALYRRLSTGDIDLQSVYERVESAIPQLAESLRVIGIDPAQLQTQLSSAAVGVSQYLASWALALGQDTLRITVLFFLMLYLLFFFFRDGPKLIDGMVHSLP